MSTRKVGDPNSFCAGCVTWFTVQHPCRNFGQGKQRAAFLDSLPQYYDAAKDYVERTRTGCTFST